MPRGKPDFGAGSYGVSINQFDTNDIVAAVRGFGRIDGKGRIMFFDDFSLGLSNWYTTSVGTVHNPEICNTQSKGFISGLSCVAETPAPGNTSLLSRNMILPVIDTIGIEVAINIEDGANDMYVTYARTVSAGNRRNLIVYTDVANSLIKISALEGEIAIPGITFPSLIYNGWMNYKIVADFDLNSYMRFICYNRVFDLSAYHLPVAPAGNIDQLLLATQNNGIANVKHNYWGLCVVTLDEP